MIMVVMVEKEVVVDIVVDKVIGRLGKVDEDIVVVVTWDMVEEVDMVETWDIVEEVNMKEVGEPTLHFFKVTYILFFFNNSPINISL